MLAISVALVGVVLIVPEVSVTDESVAVPPVIATVLAFWVDIVPKPVMSVLGMVELAVSAAVPVPLT